MKIFEILFGEKKLETVTPTDSVMIDLMLDWLNISDLKYPHFKNTFLEPALKLLKTHVVINQHFLELPEPAENDYHTWLLTAYLVYHNPDNALLRRLYNCFFNHQAAPNARQWLSRGNGVYYQLATPITDPFVQVEIANQLIQCYHAIHVRADRISDINTVIQHLSESKFRETCPQPHQQPSPHYFEKLFYYVKNQSFKEKLYVFFKLYISTKIHYSFVKNEKDEVEWVNPVLITTSPHDAVIRATFIETIQEHNEIYKSNFKFETFVVLQDSLAKMAAVPFERNKKLQWTDLSIFDGLRQAAKQDAQHLLDHIIYFLNENPYYAYPNYYNRQETAVWREAIKCIVTGLKCDTKWLLNQFKQPIIANDPLIFDCILTKLLDNLKNKVSYDSELAQTYETLVFARMSIKPTAEKLNILRHMVQNIENIEERQFQNSKLGHYYANPAGLAYSPLLCGKSFEELKLLIEDLSHIIPVGLKQINEKYNASGKAFLELTYQNQTLLMSRNHMLTNMNRLLEQAVSGYRLVWIPVAQRMYESERYSNYYIGTLAFMSYKEFEYFKERHLKPFLEKTFPNTDVWTGSELADIRYAVQDAIPFETLKAQVLAAKQTITINNYFLQDENWAWFKNQYIDLLQNKNQWYDIMSVIVQCKNGKIPNKKWLEQLWVEIHKMGATAYFKSLQVLMSDSFRENFWYLEQYRPALSGLIWSCTHSDAPDMALNTVKMIIEKAYTKQQGVGPKSAATGNLALEALVQSGKLSAFGLLLMMRNKTKYNRFGLVLEKCMDKFKELSPISPELLADSSIPTMGFEAGEKIIEVADFQLKLSFQGDKLLKQWFLKDGQLSKTVPEEVSLQHPKILQEINAEIKQITTVFADLKKGLKTYWLHNRSWSGENYQNYILNHGLLNPHIQNLIWSNQTQQNSFMVKATGLYTVTDELYHFEPTDVIKLWHPIENQEDTIHQWQDYIWKNNIIQPERQAFREHYPFSTTELAQTETPRFAHHFLETNKLMAIANSAGWIFTFEQHGDSWPRQFIKPLNLTVHLQCDYSRIDFAVPTKNFYFTEGNSTRINDYPPNRVPIPLKQVPLVTLSELCRDIDLFIATTSISHNPDLSQNRQEMEYYRMEYQKNLFSDNASAKIRKQVLAKLIPILKLKSSGFEGNYLLIEGSLNQYRIHLGSGFAQIRSSQKHINLIPSIADLKKNKKLRLPMNDDDTLYMILAKALFLQNDAAIQDEKIIALLV